MTLLLYVLFGIAAGILIYTYVGYPALLVMVSLFRNRRKRREPESPIPVSLLICAYNEETSIGKKIEASLALDYPPECLEIVVVSDGSTDRTDAIVGEYAQNSRVKFLRLEGRRGKTYAQNEGVKHCSGEVIVFSDATAVYHSQAIRYLAAAYSDPTVGAVSGRYKYFDPQDTSPTGLGSMAFWNYENHIKKLQSHIRTLTGCSGCIYSVRRSLYTPLPVDACSDLVEPLCIVEKGYRVAFEERALAYEETTQSNSQEFRMRVRVANNGIRSVLGKRKLLNFRRFGWIAFQLLSHKVLRWTVPVCLIVLLVTSGLLAGESRIMAVMFGLQLAFYVVSIASLVIPIHRVWKPLGIPLYYCLLNIAALVSLLGILKGDKHITWETIRN